MQTHPTTYPSDLTDEEWAIIDPLLPQPKSGPGKRGRPPKVDLRRMFNGVLYNVRSGCAWRQMPHDFGPWSTVYGFFRQWTQTGIVTRLHDLLRDRTRVLAGRKVAPTAAIIDSQSVKTPDQAGLRGYDANKKIKGRKRHIAVDTQGLLLGIHVTAADVQDRDGAKPLLRRVVALFCRLQIIWADAGYLGAFVQWVKQLRPYGKLHLDVVRRCEGTKGFKVVRRRWIVERTFAWFMKSRRLVRDYEVRTDHSEAMARLCMIRIMVRRLAKAV